MGLCVSELVGVMFGDIEMDVYGDVWLKVIGKGSKVVCVVLLLFVCMVFDCYLVVCCLLVMLVCWWFDMLLILSFVEDDVVVIMSVWLWKVM